MMRILDPMNERKAMRTIHRELVDDSTGKLWRVRPLKGGEERKNVVVVVGLFNCRKYLLVVVMMSNLVVVMMSVGKAITSI
jgi:hypothetical protein